MVWGQWSWGPIVHIPAGLKQNSSSRANVRKFVKLRKCQIFFCQIGVALALDRVGGGGWGTHVTCRI